MLTGYYFKLLLLGFFVVNLAYAETAEYYLNNAMTKANKGDLKGALKDYNKSIELGSGSTLVFESRGIIKNQLGDYNGAIQDFDRAIELEPNNAEAYMNRGIAYLNKVMDIDSIYVINDYIKALGLGFDSSLNTGNKSLDEEMWSRIKNNLSDEAIHDFNKTIELTPNNAKAYMNRGITYMYKEGGIYPIYTMNDYNSAIEIDSNYADAYFNRGYFKQMNGDYLGAIQDFNKAIELNPNYADAYYERSEAKSSIGDNNGMIQDKKKAFYLSLKDSDKYVNLYPDDPDSYIKRGKIKSKFGDIKGAIVDLNKAIELNSNNAWLYKIRGDAKIALGQKDTGCLDLSKAGELGLRQVYSTIRLYCDGAKSTHNPLPSFQPW